jgi:hypothetical protein
MLQLHFVRMAPFTGLGVWRERLHCMRTVVGKLGRDFGATDTYGVTDEAAMATTFVDGEL